VPEELNDGLKKSTSGSLKLCLQNRRLSVLLVIPMSLILNYHSDPLRRKSKDWFPWRWHQWMPQRVGENISIW